MILRPEAFLCQTKKAKKARKIIQIAASIRKTRSGQKRDVQTRSKIKSKISRVKTTRAATTPTSAVKPKFKAIANNKTMVFMEHTIVGRINTSTFLSSSVNLTKKKTTEPELLVTV